MVDDAFVVEEVRPETCPGLTEALAQAGLPVADLGQSGARFFRFWTAEGEPIGFAGAEPCGPGAVLLRSLVVLPAQRGRGWAVRMTRWLLDALARAGITDAWLLTTTIPDLAARLGFARVPRDQAPAPVRASRQFATLCPASAVLMHRRLP